MTLSKPQSLEHNSLIHFSFTKMSFVSALSSPKMSLNLFPSKTLSTTFSISKTLPFTNTTPFPTIECSSRPQKKATAHHRKTRPRKSQAWDIKRGPCVYPPLPELPPDWSFVANAEDSGAKESVEDSGSKVEIV